MVMQDRGLDMVQPARGRALTNIALCCFNERRRWWEWLPVLGDRWLRRRLRNKWRSQGKS